MRIEIKKFGTVLTSRPAGRESFLIAKSYLKPSSPNEPIELDFAGVDVLTPSWADEFVTGLKETFENKVVCLPSDNASVVESLKVLD